LLVNCGRQQQRRGRQVTAHGGMIGGTPLSDSNPVVGEAMAQLAEENALLRASIAELRARLEEMEKVSERDALTGLPNRPSFMRALEKAVSQANRHGTPAALLISTWTGSRRSTRATARSRATRP
jgi:predicted signal transduction protein with EAL and GGDEF domain